MRIIVCGSHKRGNRDLVFSCLDWLAILRIIDLLAQGGAEYIDRFAKEWAVSRGILHKEYPADWKKYGRGAGPIRNKLMLDDIKPHCVVAFPGDSGTANMVKIARNAGVPCWFPCGNTPAEMTLSFQPELL